MLLDDFLENDNRYITCYELNCDHTTNILDNGMGSGLKLIHINIRSYNKNFDNFLVYLQSISFNFDIIVLSEAWIDPDSTLTLLQGYDVEKTTTTWNRNDGVVVYFKSSLGGVVQELGMGDSTGLQLNFNFNAHNYSVLAIYRSPTMDCDLFIDRLSDHYATRARNTTHILVGDVNIDLTDSNNDAAKDLYLNTLYSKGLISCIDKPTRVTGHSSTCLDHIFTDHPDCKAVTAAVLHTSVTDHYAITLSIDTGASTDATDNTPHTTYIDYEVLGRLLESQSWDHVLALEDVNQACHAFSNTLSGLKISASKPKKIITRFKKLKPWITKDIIRDIRKRDKLSKQVKKRPFDCYILATFRTFRNALNTKIKQLKNDYYKQKILDASGKPRLFWNAVNEASGVGKLKAGFPISHLLKGSETTGEAVTEVANNFNEYFVNVGRNLANALPTRGGPPVVDDAAYATRHVFTLEPVTENQVIQCVSEMRGNSAPGFDDISTKFLKQYLRFLSMPLTHITNLSITSGVFPDCYKFALVTPLHKSGDKSNVNNYRPISLLSSISKVLERCVQKQLRFYLEENNLLSDRQFGFRESFNSNDALFRLNKNVMENLNSNKKSLIIFIDLAKAFDSLNRQTLFEKMKNLGITGKSLDWFVSYLSGRSQAVSILKQQSEAQHYDYGVVQGSSLGPLLFLVYINNVSKILTSGEIFLFADDTAVLCKGDTWPEVFENASLDITNIKKWFDQNILTMNITKTKCLPIALRKAAEPAPHLKVTVHTCRDIAGTHCTCHAIQRVDHYRYLGIVIDSQLKWDNHVESLKSKLRKYIHVFNKLSLILNQKEIKMVYRAYVESTMQYGIIAYGGALKRVIDPLIVVQKSILKAGFNKNRQYPSDLLFHETGVFTIKQMFVKQLLLYIRYNMHLVATPITHNYGTRNALNVRVQVPQAVKSINFTNAFFLANVLIRNIPAELNNTRVSASVYKKQVSAWLLESGPQYAENLLSSVYAYA